MKIIPFFYPSENQSKKNSSGYLTGFLKQNTRAWGLGVLRSSVITCSNLVESPGDFHAIIIILLFSNRSWKKTNEISDNSFCYRFFGMNDRFMYTNNNVIHAIRLKHYFSTFVRSDFHIKKTLNIQDVYLL
jgi:hypothetical protein